MKRIGGVATLTFLLATFLVGSGVETSSAESDPVLVGAGDIAGSWAEDEATAQVLDQVISANPNGRVFTLGDNAYPNGTSSDFNNYYEPTWGRHGSRTFPVPGNHDWVSVNPYFDYFHTKNSALGAYDPNRRGYYSYNTGAWHIVALNSSSGGVIDQEQLAWLQNDLSNNSSPCTLAYWHHSRFSSNKHGNNVNMAPLWDLLYQHGADVVMTGHDHGYERFDPQTPSAESNPTGIRAFVVGTGGASPYTFTTVQPNSAVRAQGVFGALKLSLHETSYDWEFVKIASQQSNPFKDSGTGNCYTGPTRNSPTPPSGITSSNPFGSFDVATTAPGGARVEGWALDPNTSDAIDMHVYVDGALAGQMRADSKRSDIGQAFTGYGNAHGFDATIPIESGFHTVCAYGLNQGAGDHALVGCRWVMIDTNPFGSFDVATTAPGGARVEGWALDPNTSDAIDMHVYVDGAFSTSVSANIHRPDISAAFPGYGSTHGFDATIPVEPGFHTVCAYGINEFAGNNSLIGCRWVMIDTNPFGSLDLVQTTSSGVRVGGWALDPQTAESISLHVYVDGSFGGELQANIDRADIGQSFPRYGNAHGFDSIISTAPGPHTVCVYGINKGPGTNTLIGCGTN